MKNKLPMKLRIAGFLRSERIALFFYLFLTSFVLTYVPEGMSIEDHIVAAITIPPIMLLVFTILTLSIFNGFTRYNEIMLMAGMGDILGDSFDLILERAKGGYILKLREVEVVVRMSSIEPDPSRLEPYSPLKNYTTFFSAFIAAPDRIISDEHAEAAKEIIAIEIMKIGKNKRRLVLYK